MPDAELLALLQKAASALDVEAAWIVGVDVDDYGRSKSSIPDRGRDFWDAVCETAQAVRHLAEQIKARREETP